MYQQIQKNYILQSNSTKANITVNTDLADNFEIHSVDI